MSWTFCSPFVKKKMLLISLLLLLSQPFFLGNCHLGPSLDSDKAALLEFKRSITFDPQSVLDNWNDTVPVCSFLGVTCNRLRHRVKSLKLHRTGLVGSLSPSLSNLTRLRNLTLSENALSGIIPPEFSSLRRLQALLLDGNSLHGPIPPFLSLLSNLSELLLLNNRFGGTIPPALFANCSSLLILDLSFNSLEGTIPPAVGNCSKLKTFHVYSNNITGVIPLSLANAFDLLDIDVENNSLSGELPSEIVVKLPNLQYLHLSYNNFTSHQGSTNLDVFFGALANCTALTELELAGIGLGGSLPMSIGNLSFQLEHLLLQENRFVGSVPPSIGNLLGLLELNLSFNLLNGSIAEEINQLQRLQLLLLSDNSFRGEIPAALGEIPPLWTLNLSNNMFSGRIPPSLGNLTKLGKLFLHNNLLEGNIPPTLGNLVKLDTLDLSHNRLTGSIPSEILRINEIRIYLNLSHNSLQGTLPFELSNLNKLGEIDLSSNNFSGSIFNQISSCTSLMRLNFSNNSLNGSLPDSFGPLQSLEVLDLSYNKLSGRIPVSLSTIQSLSFLDFSFNNFQGAIPAGGIFGTLTFKSFLGNNELCGDIPGAPKCSRKDRLFRSRIFLAIFIVVISVSAFLSTICCVIGYRRLKAILSSRRTETATDVQEPPDLVPNFPRITHKELEEATGGFDAQRLIGSGSYGRVYKGALPDGTQIAVKVLHVQSGNSTKSFNRECQVLKRIRHRNLIRIITACSQPDFKALVLPYMANGSLDSHLYSHAGAGPSSRSSDLTIIQRVNICSDIAEGMAYLHHHSHVRVIHCDLKPSNVLLNDDMTALVSDFGIARLVMSAGGGSPTNVENMGTSTANMLSGSIGYIAPEYAFGTNMSTKGDVYSFGILVLEVVTRKTPTDDMFVGGLSLARWVKAHYPWRMEKVIDSCLLRAQREQSPEVQRMWEVAIGELVELGLLCTQDHPPNRPTMMDAADDLDRLKRYLSGDTTATFTSSLGISSSNLGDD
ncbi:hypothetical protein MLD38_004952 [Melastoma candidum]|uniref:Uncharacterized protein n=1 Tax=Melastoma candidum TaxID=119954 RepID=A0ACB9SB92_9MYRT|nr:hypothetical protein MLD38_004952 [Melastoma candidum]